MTLPYTSLEALFDRYDGFLIDQFGVLLSGDGPYPGAAKALTHIRDLGKPVVILSNSGKRAEPNCARLVSHGFARDTFQTVQSSGEVAWEMMRQEIGTSIPRNARAFVVIREGDSWPLEELGLEMTRNAKSADLLLIVSRDPARSISAYEADLETLAKRNVRCFCLNPDKHMLISSQGVTEAAGHLADIYSGLGGQVTWFGKPYPAIYESAKRLLAPLDNRQILCIGDSLEHDIVGGSQASLATALVRTGVLSSLTDSELERRFRKTRHPDHVMERFALSAS